MRVDMFASVTLIEKMGAFVYAGLRSLTLILNMLQIMLLQIM